MMRGHKAPGPHPGRRASGRWFRVGQGSSSWWCTLAVRCQLTALPAAPMIIRSEADVTEAVIAELARAPDARFREILGVAVRHLHAFVREARLTEAEFQQACACIARLGQATNASHNEVVLAAGS